MSSEESSINVSDGKQGWCIPGTIFRRIPARYVFLAISVLGSLTSSIMRASMSVAIVAMVRTTNTTTNSSLQTDTDTCPGQEVVTSSPGSKTGEFEWNELTQSYILAGNTYGSLVTILIGARLAEIFGNKRVCGIAMFMNGFLNILSPICVRWNVAAFIAARVLQGFFSGPFMPANMSLFASWLPPQERARLSGIIFSASNIGSLISMGISGKMASTFGWESLFYVYGVLTALWCVLWMLLVHESPETHPWISDEEKEYIVSNTKKVAIAKKPVPWIGIIFNVPFCSQIIMDIGITWIVFILTTELPTYLKNILHFDTESASYITALPYLASWLSNVSSGIISQWLRHKGYVSHMTAYRIFNGIAALGPAVSLIIITQLGCDSVSIIILFTITLLFNGCYFGGSKLGVLDLGVNFAGTMSGISGTITGVTSIIAPTIVGAVTNNHQTISAWTTVFYISSAMSALPYISYIFFGSVKEQPWNKLKVVKSNSDLNDETTMAD